MNRTKMPGGMIFILILVGWGILSLLISLRNPVSQLGPILLTGTGALIVNLIILAILSAIFAGIIRRFVWARKLAIGWYIAYMLLAVINLLSFMENKAMFDAYYRSMLSPDMAALMTPTATMIGLIFSVVVSWITGIIITMYLLKRKDYFTE